MYFIQYYEYEEWFFYENQEAFHIHTLALDTMLELRKEFPDFKYRLLKCEVLDD